MKTISLFILIILISFLSCFAKKTEKDKEIKERINSKYAPIRQINSEKSNNLSAGFLNFSSALALILAPAVPLFTMTLNFVYSGQLTV